MINVGRSEFSQNVFFCDDDDLLVWATTEPNLGRVHLEGSFLDVG